MAKKQRKIDVLAERFGGKWKWNGGFSHHPFTCDDGRSVEFMAAISCGEGPPYIFSDICHLYDANGKLLEEFYYWEI